jgi:predicted metal-dependent hydrolase
MPAPAISIVMTQLVVRRLLIDLQAPFPVRWNGGDAFRSAFFNALSMSFPVGEQFFIDSVRAGLKSLPDAQRAAFADEVQGFVGQEATHRRIHALFNAHLVRQGQRNDIERRALHRLQANAGRDVRVHVAATAATEHFTAIFASWLMRHPEALHGAEPRLQTLWLWHAAEEAEHRCTAFDLYQALSGDHAWRVRLFRYVTVIFLGDVMRQTLLNLWHDGSLWRWSTWRSGWRLLLSRDGMFRGSLRAWRDYFARDFHPSQHDAGAARQWLHDHAASYAVVAAAGT